MNVLESASGWYTIDGFSTTKDGHLDLKGFITPTGALHVFKVGRNLVLDDLYSTKQKLVRPSVCQT